jgi:hypothetical protein
MSEETRESDVLDARQVLRPNHIPEQPRLVATEMGWKPRYSNTKILQESCDWFLSEGHETQTHMDRHTAP